ncbi:DUF3095 domain-containing protein [Jiella pelagia]|uniref:DUF3095 domain-containing protein n=1 Tax=Jiella pelagia TaxID=2986949 RepID=A0ABY7BV23_9HYPH|nr:DUF3095 domain-containing protein [Jiella pelagia]WAP67651.1 DUF3095 domain-containing protein [Jiella pelagia]
MTSHFAEADGGPGRGLSTVEAASPADPLGFFAALPVEADFARLADPCLYHSLPAGWVVGLADIERSTDAVAAGRYKAVNTVAAAVIAAVANQLSGRDFPFVFAGDGASFALPPEHAAVGKAGLAAVAGWARDAFGFKLRAAIVPVEMLRAEGHDVRIARFAASPDVSYTMFSGGGLAFAERRMKEGAFFLEAGVGEDARPDLTGLSCRFSAIPARHGVILSLIMLPTGTVATERFSALAAEILSLAAKASDAGRPVPEEGPAQTWPSAGLMIEARTAAARTGRPLWLSAISVGIRSFLAHLSFATGTKVGEFEPARYRGEIARNTDFRKFDDGLRLTLDCSPRFADRIAETLSQAEAEGIAMTGLHRQDAALMTCFVPVASRSDHVHFVDGAMGGYGAAALMAFGKASPKSEAKRPARRSGEAVGLGEGRSEGDRGEEG